MTERRPVREAPPRQGVVLPETPEVTRQLEGLRADVADTPLADGRLNLRLRNFQRDPSAYLASLGGPLPYMVRLREIERLTALHVTELEARYQTLLSTGLDTPAFALAWMEVASAARFGEINALIDRHNRWYPIEARLPMDPRRGDYALVNGRDYRIARLDAQWVTRRWPASVA